MMVKMVGMEKASLSCKKGEWYQESQRTLVSDIWGQSLEDKKDNRTHRKEDEFISGGVESKEDGPVGDGWNNHDASAAPKKKRNFCSSVP